MYTIDLIFGIPLILAAIQGFRKGLFVELASLVGLIAGLYGAIHFSYYVGNWLFEKTAWSEQIIRLTAFAVTFIIIVLTVSLAGKLLTKVANFAMLGLVNKLLGSVFAILKYALLLSVVLMFIDAADRQLNILGEDKKAQSVLYPLIQPLAPAILPELLKKKQELEEQDETQTNHSI